MNEVVEKFEIALEHKEREAEEKDNEITSANQEIQKLGDTVYRLEDENDRLKEESARIREEDAVELERLDALSHALKEVKIDCAHCSFFQNTICLHNVRSDKMYFITL